MLEKIVRWGIYVVAIIPLVIFKEFFSPFHFGKVVVFRTLIELVAVLYVLLVLRDKSFLPRRSGLFWAMTIFTAVFGVTSLTGVYPYQSIMGTLERMGGWFTFLHFWLFFVMATSVLRTREHWLTLIKISVFASLLSTFYGFLQKGSFAWVIGSGSRIRIFGTLGNTALFAGYTLVNVFFALFLTVRDRGMMRALFGIIAVLNVIAIFMTAVRGAILGIVFAVALMAFAYALIGSSKKIRLSLLAAVLLLFAGIGFLFINRESDIVKNSRFLSRMVASRTAQTRLWAWQAGIDGWNDSPKTILLGWGPENFNIPFSKHFNPKFYFGIGSETLFDRAHNMFVEVLVTMGLVGFAAYLGMFIVLFLLLWKLYGNQPAPAIILGSGLVAYMVQNAFIFDTSANLVAFFLFAGLVNALLSVPSSPPASSRPVPATLRYSLALAMLALVLFSIYRTNVLPARANYAGTRATVHSWSNEHEQAIKKFETSLSHDTFLSYELRHRYAQYVLENYGEFGAQGIDAGSTVMAVIKHVERNLASPQDYLPYLYISRSYIILGKSDPASPFNDLALENSLKALEISPTFVRTYYEVAQAYLNKKDYVSALAAFQKAVDLNPDVAVSWWYLGVAQVEAGDQVGGLASIEKALELGYTAGEQELLRLVNLYETNRNFEKVAELYEQLIRISPKNPQYHASLAATYANLGRIEDAVREAKIAARINPSFETEARAFVKSIGGTW